MFGDNKKGMGEIAYEVQYQKYMRGGNAAYPINSPQNGFQSTPNKTGAVTNFHLTKDINTATGNSYPSNNLSGYDQKAFAVLNGISYFGADDGINGDELWRSDGTSAGTYMVKDIIPGGSGSFVSDITAIDGLLYFSANTYDNGREPWISDGTAAGTKLLFDINNGPASSYPSQFVKVNNTVIFTTENDFTQGQIWKTNGTSGGTTLVYGFNGPDPYSGYVTEAIEDNGLYFFSAFTIDYGRELWRSDGTAAGTYMVKDIGPGVDDYFGPLQLTKYDNKLYYSGDDGTGRRLWLSDGTAAGTYPVQNNDVFIQNDYLNYNNNAPFAVLGNVLYLSGFTYAAGSGLYKYDVAANAGIELVKDLLPGTDVCFVSPPDLRVVGNSLYFKVVNSIYNYHDELWTSQGQSTNTQLVKEYSPGEITTNYYNISGTLYFVEEDPASGPELWTSNGTLPGTFLIKDIYPGQQGSFPFFLTPFNGKIMFSAISQSTGAELWLSDATSGGTVMVKDINKATTLGSSPGSMYKGTAALGKKIVFNAFELRHGNELFISDGSTQGTRLINDILPGPDGSNPGNFLAKKEAVYFQAFGTTGNPIYKTDGTSAGLKKMIDLNINAYISNYAVADNGLIFYVLFSYNTFNYELWRSDGTPEGNYRLSANAYYNNGLITVGNDAFFVGGDEAHGYELWKSDGRLPGTKMFADINKGPNGSYPYSLFAFKNNVYFGAIDNPDYIMSFWRTNEKSAVKLKEVFPDFSFDGDYYNNSIYCISGNELYFAAYDQNYDNELYKTRGERGNTILVKDINPYYSSSPNNLTNVGGTIFFTADDGVYGSELWSTTGTPASTKLVKDITPDIAGTSIGNLWGINGKLYFLKDLFSNNSTFWSSDGTDNGTGQVTDQALDGLSQFTNLLAADNHLFFGASSYQYGSEMWVGTANVSNAEAERLGPVTSSAIKSSTSFEASLYPNPASDVVTLQIKGDIKNIIVTIADISGKNMWQQSFKDQPTINLPVAKISAGVYMVTITTNEGSKTITLVKE